MKTKKVMSKEALELLFTEETTAEDTVEVEETAEEASEETAEETTEETTSEETAEDTDDSKLAELVQAEFDDYRLTTDAETTELKEKLEASEAKYDTALDGLKDIVVGQIAKMRTALNIAKVDMSDWDIDAVVAEYDSTKDAFVKALPVGSVIPEKKEKKTKNPVSSSLDASNVKSLGF